MERGLAITRASSLSVLGRIPLDPIGLGVSSWSSKSEEVQSAHPPSHDLPARVSEAAGPMVSVKARGEEGVKGLCLAYTPVCEVTNLIKQQTNVVSDPPFAVNMFK